MDARLPRSASLLVALVAGVTWSAAGCARGELKYVSKDRRTDPQWRTVGVGAAAVPAPVAAATPSPPPAQAPAPAAAFVPQRKSPRHRAEARTALVIGNSRYSKQLGALRNPKRDSADIAATLRRLGFETLLVQNGGLERMQLAVNEFRGALLRRQGVGVFYFAGHGVQLEGSNYLVPSDARGLTEANLPFRSLQVAEVVRTMQMAKLRLSVVILDACRNNPLPRTFRSGATRGLAVMAAPPATIVMYAAAADSVAADGAGRNGVFTQYLLRHMTTPGVPVEQVFKAVGRDVHRHTGGAQTPQLNSLFYDEFYFQRR